MIDYSDPNFDPNIIANMDPSDWDMDSHALAVHGGFEDAIDSHIQNTGQLPDQDQTGAYMRQAIQDQSPFMNKPPQPSTDAPGIAPMPFIRKDVAETDDTIQNLPMPAPSGPISGQTTEEGRALMAQPNQEGGDADAQSNGDGSPQLAQSIMDLPLLGAIGLLGVGGAIKAGQDATKPHIAKQTPPPAVPQPNPGQITTTPAAPPFDDDGIHEIADVKPPKDLATDTHPDIEKARNALPEDKRQAIDPLVNNGMLANSQPGLSNINSIGDKTTAEHDFNNAVKKLGGDPNTIGFDKTPDGTPMKKYIDPDEDVALTYRETSETGHPTIDINIKKGNNGSKQVIKRRYVTDDKNRQNNGP